MEGFGGLIGLVTADAAGGEARLAVAAGPEHLNGAGTVHGGFLATLADSAMGAAVRSLTGEDDVPATSQLTLAYLRPGRIGSLVVTAKVRKRGAHLLVCEAEIDQGEETLVHAVATFALLHG
ncbi:MAG: thioesterase superfamily protein [Jatrophihabitantaceae bacterium]|nr:thioesterase superfamily protein [Jatrophihabitantaceae bacterium]